MEFVGVVLCCIFVALVYKVILFFAHVRNARRTGLPYTLSFVHELENVSYISTPFFRWRYSEYLMRGNGWPKWARFMVKDWGYEDKGRAHEEFGDVFLVVSPGGIVCYVGDAKVALSVCTRRKDFIKPAEKMKMLEPFGPNVVSTEGDLWRLHQRITVPSLGESVNKLVWSETFRQTESLVSSWVSVIPESLKSEIYSLTINIMACAAFGQRAKWSDTGKTIPSGHEMSLVSAVQGLVMHLPHILLLPKILLRCFFRKTAYRSYIEYGKYLGEFHKREKERLELDSKYESSVKGNLLTALLKSNLSEQKGTTIRERTALTDREILGNTFIFLLAGYDTTANTLLFSVIALAIKKDLQDRIIEEIDGIYEEAVKEGRRELCYNKDLPKFRYTLAFMHEILRVFPIVLPIGRMITQPQSLTVEKGSTVDTSPHSSRSFTLPAQCGVIINNTGVHYSKQNWQHPEIIDPHRWLSSNPNTWDPLTARQEDIDAFDRSTPIPSHAKGSFLTFSEGPRACLGKRFSQVEFVAFFAALLKDHRLQLAGTLTKEDVERSLRLRSGGSPVTLIPHDDVPISLQPRH